MLKNQPSIQSLKQLAKLIRYYILLSTTEAGSGHPTTCLSAADLATSLFFSEFKFDFTNPQNPANDRLIFSKGHAAPLLYSLYAAAGLISEKELLDLRKIDSPLEGHPTPEFKYIEVATGSLGQGLSVGLGMAIAIRKQIEMERSSPSALLRASQDKNLPRVFVLIGDGEMAEGSIWEAIEVASYYKLNNLIGILDVNRLGQSGETMLGWDVKTYEEKIKAFGWNTIIIDGHDFKQISEAFSQIRNTKYEIPVMIIAKTIKGKGVSFLEDKEGWHGKAVPKKQLEEVLKELGEVDLSLRGEVKKPELSIKYQVLSIKNNTRRYTLDTIPYKLGDLVATREAYGEALVKLGEIYPNLVVLDGDVKNSTYSEKFKEKFPERFFEMFIAEQNMVSAALGMGKRGFIPFASTFAAFLTRAFDQIRMAAVSRANIKLCGSHAGVSIGEDGASQMGLEDLAMMRAIFNSTVLYPSDSVSAAKLVFEMVNKKGIVYIRTTRGKMPVIYNNEEEFPIGGSKTHSIKNQVLISSKYLVTVVATGITLHEALAAQKELAKEDIYIQVIDCYSIKPIDKETLRKAAKESKAIITVEDHWLQGGLGEAVLEALGEEKSVAVYKLAVKTMPHSGKPQELLEKAGIDRKGIVRKVKKILQ